MEEEDGGGHRHHAIRVASQGPNPDSCRLYSEFPSSQWGKSVGFLSSSSRAAESTRSPHPLSSAILVSGFVWGLHWLERLAEDTRWILHLLSFSSASVAS
jgi:hypothetical protein